MLAEGYYACGDYFAMAEEMKGIDIEALPGDELERLVVTFRTSTSLFIRANMLPSWVPRVPANPR